MTRRDAHTLNLFDWEPPRIAAGYGDDVAGRGALDNQIARLVSRALRDARDDGMKRSEIAKRISAALDRPVSQTMLDKWASESSTDHRIPLDAFIALIQVTNATDLLGFIPGMFGFVAVPEKFAGIIELHLIEDHENDIAARKAALRAKWKSRR